MRIDRNGQAKILSQEEIFSFFNEGCECYRDRALFGLCLYTACRISEARQAHYIDVFNGEKIRDAIVLRKCNTKGKQETRVIPTHPDLAKLLNLYRMESIELGQLKETHGTWGHFSRYSESRAICPRCQSIKTKKKGFSGEKQKYQCKNCHFYFREPDRAEDFMNRQIDISCCPHCQSKHVTKRGSVDGKQRYMCESCHRSFFEFYALKWHSAKPVTYSSIETISTSLITFGGVKALSNYGLMLSNPANPYLFPGYRSQGCLSERQAHKLFDNACKKIGLEGAGTHSFRRTTLTQLHNSGFPLRVLQKISGHRDLASLQSYLEVTDEQIQSAVNFLR
jgi:integrase